MEVSLIQKILYESELEIENFMDLPYLQPRPEAKRKYQQILKERNTFIEKINLGLSKINFAYQSDDYKDKFERLFLKSLSNCEIRYNFEMDSKSIEVFNKENKKWILLLNFHSKFCLISQARVLEPLITIIHDYEKVEKFLRKMLEKYFKIKTYKISY